jgi:hypothetical protein
MFAVCSAAAGEPCANPDANLGICGGHARATIPCLRVLPCGATSWCLRTQHHLDGFRYENGEENDEYIDKV